MSSRSESIAVLAFADELCDDPSLLAAWAGALGGHERIALVIHPGRLGSGEVAARMRSAALAAGIDGDGTPQLVALTGPLHAGEEARLADRCDAVFTRRDVPEPFAGLAHVDERTVAHVTAQPLPTAGSGVESAFPSPNADGGAPVSFTLGRHSYCAEPPPQLIAYGEGRRVEVGSFCSISGNVRFFLDGGHRADLITTRPLHSLGLAGPPGHNSSKGAIVIGHDVWIGHSATILSGVTVGTGAVIGTCAVVASDVRPYAVVAGNPAREIKRRFEDEDCELLLASQWWRWSDEKIVAALGDLWSSDVRTFVTRWAT